MIDEKTQRILQSAFKVFAAYGFKRVTMADIAKEAGMSRPALYLGFKEKEAIFRAMVESFNQETISEIRKGILDLDTLEKQLEFIFENWLVKAYEMIHSSPHGNELIDEGYGVAGDLMDELYESFETLFFEILEPQRKQLEKAEIEPQSFVRFIRVSAKSCKMHAKSVEELRSLISVLTKTILKVAES